MSDINTWTNTSEYFKWYNEQITKEYNTSIPSIDWSKVPGHVRMRMMSGILSSIKGGIAEFNEENIGKLQGLDIVNIIIDDLNVDKYDTTEDHLPTYLL